MFDTFRLEFIKLPEATLRVRCGGSGFPVLLLHGHPRTHMTWQHVAPSLAETYTVVCPDLRGFGQSSKPVDTPDHSLSSKRAKANDCIALMQHLGHQRFAVVGHDRGAYVAFRLAMDYPESVSQLVVLDAVPIVEALERCTEKFARLWWHWFFFAQPDKPERAILADPDAWYNASKAKDFMSKETFADFYEAIHDPATVHAMLEDYRAGLGVDRAHDEADRKAGKQIICPTLVGWSLKDDMEELYGDVLGVWRPWVRDNLSGFTLDCGHHMAEEAPEALASRLRAFFQT
jgi:haloacetate dehalogenase